MLPMSAGWMSQMFEPLNVAIDVADGLSKAKITTTRIGRYRKAYTSMAQIVKPRFAVKMRRLRTELLLACREDDVDHDEHREGRHERDRERRAERPVLGVAERVADDVPDELELPAAEAVRNDVFAAHRDEHEQGAGHDAGQREPERDVSEGRERPRPEVGGGLDQRPVHPLERREDGQDEERQVVVDEADPDG